VSDVDLKIVEQIVEQIGGGSEKVLEILQALQKEFDYLPPQALERVCQISDITPASIEGVATFYSQFRHRPAGKHRIRVCIGTACHVKGASQIFEAFMRYLNIKDDDDTDDYKVFTVEKVACLGCCSLAPAVQIDDITYGHLTNQNIPAVLDDFLEHQNRSGKKDAAAKTPSAEIAGEVRICKCSSCVAGGSADVFDAFEKAAARINAPVTVKSVGCSGMSFLAPYVEIVTDAETYRYAQIKPEDADGIIARHFKSKSIPTAVKSGVSRMLDTILQDKVFAPVTRYPADVRERQVAEYLGGQKHIATENCGCCDPLDIDEYIASGGFEALKKSLTIDGGDVVSQIEKSGIRGRGGGGFPTGVKWSTVRSQDSEKKYIICNGDEGDPGAFMDRMLMESFPYRIIEGLAIAAYAVGADEGFLYIRAEYPLAIKRMHEAVLVCNEKGLLGENIDGSGFSLKLKISVGAGAFVCGEETALLSSIEGKRGMPRLRPPYPAEAGLWGMPTLINNVETYSMVPWILRNGAEEFSQFGTETSRGTKVFALAGKVARGGLIEVPMGISIKQVIEDIGGGMDSDKPFKAVQIGGPSGGCVPAKLSHTAVDYESLKEIGTMMGSGGMVALDENDCMVDIARYFLEFTQQESCGKCTFCRIGTKRMLEILERLCLGDGKKGDVEELERLGRMVKSSSLCGLGKTAPNPVLSTIKYFREEYEAHIEGKCPAGSCRALIHYSITDDCIGCTICAQRCPVDAIEFKPYEKHEIDQEKCIRCGTCKTVCPADAVAVE
jgi:NADH:ubiquinone oxidoreductase subunit F (NADH-binding)/NADH:ubiquinone oxidoreductase subunit E